jgi:hypothetical protein
VVSVTPEQPAWEIDYQKEAVIMASGVDAKVALRVRYRKPGTRRWTRFLLFPQEGQTFGMLIDHLPALVAQYQADIDARREARRA